MEAAVSVNSETVLYLYGLVHSRANATGLTAVEPGCDIFFVTMADVACAVSAVPASAYHHARAGMTPEEQLEWVTPRAWRHHDVLCRLHLAGTVVPLKFGTLCSTVTEVEAMLLRLHDPVSELLCRFERKDEWTLKICHDADALARAMQQRDPDLLALQAEGHGLPQGRAYFVRKKLQRATADRAASRLAAVYRHVHARLLRLGIEIGSGDGHEAQMPVLVERSRFREIEAALADLEGEHADSHVTFELVGPWPPYSFASVALVP